MASGNGRTALVTDASRGIGRAIALGPARGGFDVVVNDIARQEAELASVAEEIATSGRRGIALLADVSDRAQVAAMVRPHWPRQARSTPWPTRPAS